MKYCIYCRQLKREDEFTLEHVIPKFLGGSYAPDTFKTKDVCSSCNNNLGLFADAAFEKDFLVYQQLTECAQAFFTHKKPIGLPMLHLGVSALKPPSINDNEVCEIWLGPFGETIFWIRPVDNHTYWYSGGNPRTVKNHKTRAYFILSQKSEISPPVVMYTFKHAFEGRKVKKILCGTIEGLDISTIGFAELDELDNLRKSYFLESLKNNREAQHGQIPKYLRYDLRFMAKLAIGIPYTLFGANILNNQYSQELYKALWFREGNDFPKIYGSLSPNIPDPFLENYCGVKYGTTIAILPTPQGISINLNINRAMNWTIKCCEITDLKEQDIHNLGDGICIILYKTLQTGITLPLSELISHNSGNNVNTQLKNIEQSADKYTDYINNLRKIKI